MVSFNATELSQRTHQTSLFLLLTTSTKMSLVRPRNNVFKISESLTISQRDGRNHEGESPRVPGVSDQPGG